MLRVPELEKIKKKIKFFEEELLKENTADPCSASYHFYSVTVPEIQREVIEKLKKELRGME